MANLKPLGDRVIIEPLPKKEKKTKSGIVLSSGGNAGYDKTEEIHGTVLAVGASVTQVKAGDMVTLPAYGYDTVTDENPDDATAYMSVREGDLLAIITN